MTALLELSVTGATGVVEDSVTGATGELDDATELEEYGVGDAAELVVSTALLEVVSTGAVVGVVTGTAEVLSQC